MPSTHWQLAKLDLQPRSIPWISDSCNQFPILQSSTEIYDISRLTCTKSNSRHTYSTHVYCWSLLLLWSYYVSKWLLHSSSLLRPQTLVSPSIPPFLKCVCSVDQSCLTLCDPSHQWVTPRATISCRNKECTLHHNPGGMCPPSSKSHSSLIPVCFTGLSDWFHEVWISSGHLPSSHYIVLPFPTLPQVFLKSTHFLNISILLESLLSLFTFYFGYCYWSIVNLQYCVSFRYIAKWSGYLVIHVYTFLFSNSFP